MWHCLCYKHRGEEDNRLTVKSYHLIEPPYCIYKIKQNLRNPADDLTPACPIVGSFCGADFDTKFHQEQKPCFHNNGCLATLL